MTVNIKSLSVSQQVALWVILHFDHDSFYTSEVSESNLFTEKGKYAIGGIMSSLAKNDIIEKISGGRDKLWKLNDAIANKKGYYIKELNQVKSYWR